MAKRKRTSAKQEAELQRKWQKTGSRDSLERLERKTSQPQGPAKSAGRVSPK